MIWAGIAKELDNDKLDGGMMMPPFKAVPGRAADTGSPGRELYEV